MGYRMHKFSHVHPNRIDCLRKVAEITLEERQDFVQNVDVECVLWLFLELEGREASLMASESEVDRLRKELSEQKLLQKCDSCARCDHLQSQIDAIRMQIAASRNTSG